MSNQGAAMGRESPLAAPFLYGGMQMNICEVTGPAYWASALVNGDQGGLTVEEVIQINAWRKREGIKCVLGTKEDSERFTWAYRLYAPECDCDGGAVLDYICEV